MGWFQLRLEFSSVIFHIIFLENLSIVLHPVKKSIVKYLGKIANILLPSFEKSFKHRRKKNFRNIDRRDIQVFSRNRLSVHGARIRGGSGGGKYITGSPIRIISTDAPSTELDHEIGRVATDLEGKRAASPCRNFSVSFSTLWLTAAVARFSRRTGIAAESARWTDLPRL